MKNAIVIGTAATYAEDLATIEARNAYWESIETDSGEARPYVSEGWDDPLEALTSLWLAINENVIGDDSVADPAPRKARAPRAPQRGACVPLMFIGNPSHGVPIALAPGRRGKGHERTSVRGVAEGAPIRNAGTLAASLANGGLAVDAKTRKAASKAAETPEQSAARRARKAAALKAKRHAAK